MTFHYPHKRPFFTFTSLTFDFVNERRSYSGVTTATQKTMATYNTVVLAKRPTGDIKAGETFELKSEKRIEESDLKDGQVLVETRYLSLDPAMRGWLNG